MSSLVIVTFLYFQGLDDVTGEVLSQREDDKVLLRCYKQIL